jgi:ABC-2 type transport system ATP-binding protein
MMNGRNLPKPRMSSPNAILKIEGLEKVYPNGHRALSNIHLTVQKGELFALLGPNGAGKTTLIGAVAGLVRKSAGKIWVDDIDLDKSPLLAKKKIGLVPQELHTDMFETVWDTVTLSRGLFGLAKDDAKVEQVLSDLSLIDKRKAKIMTLSGGMKRRVLIAKALVHDPLLLFLDEPTAGVDVELRRDMWKLVARLRERGVTIVLTTHYLEEAEKMADRVGVIQGGELLLVENKSTLMQKLGKRLFWVELEEPLSTLPEALRSLGGELSLEGHRVTFPLDTGSERIFELVRELDRQKLVPKDMQTKQSSLEEIFVDLVSPKGGTSAARVNPASGNESEDRS